MKKLNMLLACILLLLSAVACQDNNENKQQSGNEQNNPPSSIDNEEAQNDNQDEENNDETTPSEQDNEDESSNQNENGDDKQEEQKTEDGMIVVAKPKSTLVLVNKTHKLPDGYIPPNLVYPDIRFPYDDLVEKRQVRKVIEKPLKELFAAADEAGYKLYGVSGYRSYNRQVNIFNRNVDRYGLAKASTISAHPGTSEHQTGLTIDITSQEMLQYSEWLTQKFGSTEAGKWVANNGHKYGFIIRYPKGEDEITGYTYEPWHIRYVGVEAATYIYENDLTLEGYFKEKDQ